METDYEVQLVIGGPATSKQQEPDNMELDNSFETRIYPPFDKARPRMG